MEPKMIFKDAQQAFREAIESGRLSRNESAPNFAGDYMYMGTWGGVDLFKNIVTRNYLPEAR